MTLETAKVPASMEALFSDAQKYVESYFHDLKFAPRQGTIFVDGERYILVRASSMSVHFLEFLKNMYPSISEAEAIEAASIVLYDIAHSIGLTDARAFHAATQVTEPIPRVSTGPIHFAYTGWAFVEILPSSRPTVDEDFTLIYDHHNSFEADSWIKLRGKTDFCTCFMNAGYSAGWVQESFGLALASREISCRAKGDPQCRFVMAQPHRLEEFVHRYCAPDELQRPKPAS